MRMPSILERKKTQACQHTLTNIGKEVFTFVVNNNQNKPE